MLTAPLILILINFQDLDKQIKPCSSNMPLKRSLRLPIYLKDQQNTKYLVLFRGLQIQIGQIIMSDH